MNYDVISMDVFGPSGHVPQWWCEEDGRPTRCIFRASKYSGNEAVLRLMKLKLSMPEMKPATEPLDTAAKRWRRAQEEGGTGEQGKQDR